MTRKMMMMMMMMMKKVFLSFVFQLLLSLLLESSFFETTQNTLWHSDDTHITIGFSHKKVAGGGYILLEGLLVV